MKINYDIYVNRPFITLKILASIYFIRYAGLQSRTTGIFWSMGFDLHGFISKQYLFQISAIEVRVCQNPGVVHESRPSDVQIDEKHPCMIMEYHPIYISCNQREIPRLYSQWLNSVISWLINHCMDWARTGVKSFSRQFDFHAVIYHIWHCNVDNRRCNVVFT